MGALDVPVLGLNCATGPKEMAEHIRHLGQSWPGLISVLPNAGLPELRCGHPHYPLGAEELARWLERFIQEDGVNIVGGCCGTGAEHIAAVDAMLRRIAEDGYRPRPKARQPVWSPSLASLFSPVPLRQESAYLAIGERCNANGSKKFRELQASGDWDGCVAMGKEQAREASHALDVCTAYRRPRRGERHARGDLAHARPGRCAAGDRFDRAAGARVRARALWRQGRPELDQLRGRGGPGREADGAGQEARQCGDSTHHRRGGHGEDGGGQAPRRPPPGRLRLRPLRPAAVGPADRPAHLHRLHRQRGRPQAGPVDPGRDRDDPGRVPRAPDHPGPLQHLLRPQRRRPARAEFGHARPRHAPRSHRGHRPQQQDHAAAQDPGGGGAQPPRT